MRGKIMRGLEAAADVMLPRTCVVCERRLNIDERHLCLHCMAELPLTYFWGRSRNPMADRFNLLIENGAGPDPADAGREDMPLPPHFSFMTERETTAGFPSS